MTTPTNEAGHGLPEVAAAREVIRAYFAGELDDTMILNLSESLALSRGVPADMVLVPREPTPEMQRAYFDSIDKHLDAVAKSPFFGRHDNHRVAYRAMLAAAPAAAGAQGEVEAGASVSERARALLADEYVRNGWLWVANHLRDGITNEWQDAALRALEQALTQQRGEVAWNVLQIGSRGAAYDPPNSKRAFTYEQQPGNVDASRLGNALANAANASYGDSIDRGLALLKALQESGFGVFQIGNATNPQPAAADGGVREMARIIAMLVEVARAAHYAMDDCGDLLLTQEGANDLSNALDSLDDLPELDDAYVRDGWCKAKDHLAALEQAMAQQTALSSHRQAGDAVAVVHCDSFGTARMIWNKECTRDNRPAHGTKLYTAPPSGADLSKFRELAERWRANGHPYVSDCADELIALVEKGVGNGQ